MFAKRLLLVLFLLAVLLVALQAAPAVKVTIPTQTMTGNQLQLPGVLHKPDGNGPFPAVVMLCGCEGYSSEPDATQQSTWAERLAGWGYVALQLDSFTPRGYPNGVCDNTGIVNDAMRSDDAFAAKAYLSTIQFVDSKNIAVIGWSHGGWAVMKIIDGYVRDKKVSPFKAAVAIYPNCTNPFEPDTPLLVLIGKKDDWCPASLAENLQDLYSTNSWKPEFSLTVYPNAYHAFDYEMTSPGGKEFMGHHIEYDPAATADAITKTKDFLAKYCLAQ